MKKVTVLKKGKYKPASDLALSYCGGDRNKDDCIYVLGELIQICHDLGIGCTCVQPSMESASKLVKQLGWHYQAANEEIQIEEDTEDLLEDLSAMEKVVVGTPSWQDCGAHVNSNYLRPIFAKL